MTRALRGRPVERARSVYLRLPLFVVAGNAIVAMSTKVELLGYERCQADVSTARLRHDRSAR